MSDIDQVFEETRQAYYRALIELQEKFAAEFEQLAVEENKALGSEAKHMAKTHGIRTIMKSREIYSWVIGFIFAVIIFRMMDGDWTTVSALLIGLVPFLQDLRRKIEEDK